MKEKQTFYGVIEKFHKDKARAKEELKQVVMNVRLIGMLKGI